MAQRSQGERYVITVVLNAWEKALETARWFFPGGDDRAAPQTSFPWANATLLRVIGLCHRNLGHLREAVPFFERAREEYAHAKLWSEACIISQNLSEIHTYLGNLNRGLDEANFAMFHARKCDKSTSAPRVPIVGGRVI